MKKRILQINKLYYPFVGGIERVVQNIAEGLAEKTEMTVLVSSTEHRLVKEEIKHVKVIRVPSLFMLGNLPISFGLIRQVRHMRNEIDVINLHMPYPLGDIACLLSGYKGKIVVWWHSDVVRQKKMMYLYRPVMEKMLQRADTIIVATEGHIKGSAYLGPYKDKCVVIPYGVDRMTELSADQYFFNNYNQKRICNKVRFLFVGRLVYYKGVKVLINAFQHVRNRGGTKKISYFVWDGP